MSENYYPGWTAPVDGRPAATARADYTLMGVTLPAGDASLELHLRTIRRTTPARRSR